MKTLVDTAGNFMFTFEGEIDLSLPEYEGCSVIEGNAPLQSFDEQQQSEMNLAFAEDDHDHEAEVDDLIIRVAALEQKVAELENDQSS
mgnify:CR=1 FL=1